MTTGASTGTAPAHGEGEHDLLPHKELYRTYADLTGQIPWAADANGEVEKEIPYWRAYTGQTREEAAKWGWLTCVHPEDADRVRDAWSNAVAARSAYEAEFRVRRYDGAYRYLLCVAAPLVGDDGGVREWVGTCVDVTERRQAVELANRVAELEAVLAAENDAVLVYGTDLNVSDANPAFLDRYGFNPVGLNVKDILDRLSCRRLDGTPFLPEEQPTLRALRGETVSGARFLITREVGPETILEISSCPMLVGGRIVGAVAVWRDVTEREHAREGLLRVRTQLEYRLHEMAETVHKALDDAEREGVDSGEPRTLTPREIEVLALVAKGKSSKTIADELLINLHTVNRHRQNLMDKLRVRKTADLVRYAISHGLVVW